MKKVKGLRSTNWMFQNSHGDVKYKMGNIVNNSVITVVSDGCEICWDEHLESYVMSNHWGIHLKLM